MVNQPLKDTVQRLLPQVQMPGQYIGGEMGSVFRLQASLENVQEFRVDSSNYPAEFGTGSGGQSAWGGRFNDEIDRSSEVYKRGYKAGTVAMANAGPNTNGSQFFIMHADYGLPPSYTIFGRVTEGQEVVDDIATTQTGRNDKPVSEVKMERVTIE